MAKHKQGKWWFLLGLAAIVAVGLGLHWATNGQNYDEETITIGSLGADVKVWQHIAASPAAKEAGLKIKVKSFTDPVQLNRGTASGEIDVNAFQSWAYLQNFNHESKHKLAALGTTYLEPMGIYSKKYHRVKDLPDGATIALANNPANQVDTGASASVKADATPSPVPSVPAADTGASASVSADEQPAPSTPAPSATPSVDAGASASVDDDAPLPEIDTTASASVND